MKKMTFVLFLILTISIFLCACNHSTDGNENKNSNSINEHLTALVTQNSKHLIDESIYEKYVMLASEYLNENGIKVDTEAAKLFLSYINDGGSQQYDLKDSKEHSNGDISATLVMSRTSFYQDYTPKSAEAEDSYIFIKKLLDNQRYGETSEIELNLASADTGEKLTDESILSILEVSLNKEEIGF